MPVLIDDANPAGSEIVRLLSTYLGGGYGKKKMTFVRV